MIELVLIPIVSVFDHNSGFRNLPADFGLNIVETFMVKACQDNASLN